MVLRTLWVWQPKFLAHQVPQCDDWTSEASEVSLGGTWTFFILMKFLFKCALVLKPMGLFCNVLASTEAEAGSPRCSGTGSAPELHTGGSRSDKNVSRQMVTAVTDAQQNPEFPLGKNVF